MSDPTPAPTPDPAAEAQRTGTTTDAARLARMTRGLSLSVAAGALIYVAFGAWSGFHEVGERLAGFRWSTFAVGLVLAAANYGLRFAKWQIFLGRLGLRVAPLRSLGIFLAGFALTVTPGKVGEVLKSFLLRVSDGVPMARTAPVVLAERITDLVACLLLIFVGAAAFGATPSVIFVCSAGALLVGALVAPVLIPRLGEWAISLVARLPALGRLAPKLREFHEATRVVLAPAPFVWTLLLSLLAWAAECGSFWVILRGFGQGFGQGSGHDAAPSLLLCTFIYALTTVGGALSFLPGGLGVQEGGMVGLLIAAGSGIDKATATAATILTRLATLWFAVLLGVVALVLVERSLRSAGGDGPVRSRRLPRRAEHE